ncbi:MAG: Fic family protein [Candidatus Hatepunaea meridiana]|nr:Fic family protein [Candidatus Hatepunaea meridiana]
MNPYYTPPKTTEINRYLDKATQLNILIENYRPINQAIWQTIQQKLKINWTYNSNAIEGSTLTYNETTFFLQHGLTVEGKPLKDFLDARNHGEAIDFLQDVINDNRQISEGLIKEINALLLAGVTHTEALDPNGQRVRKPATPGKYKNFPNHVLQLDGTIHHYIDPLQVSGEMEQLCAWIDQNIEQLHPIIVGAVAHYNFVRIHPFDDGNGRGARILMNLIFMKRRYSPAVIRNEQRRLYIEALTEADKGNTEPFIIFVAESLIQTQNNIIAELEK